MAATTYSRTIACGARRSVAAVSILDVLFIAVPYPATGSAEHSLSTIPDTAEHVIRLSQHCAALRADG